MDTEHWLLAQADWKECIAFVVPKEHVKGFTPFLKDRGKMHPAARITELDGDRGWRVIPTTLSIKPTYTQDGERNESNLAEVQQEANQLIVEHGGNRGIRTTEYTLPVLTADTPTTQSNVLSYAVNAWMREFVSSDDQDTTVAALKANLPRTYTRYGSLLLFPPGAFSNDAWRDVFETTTIEAHQELFATIASFYKATHIAINAPIPLHIPFTEWDEAENHLRTPSNLHQLYGDFGPACSSAVPTPDDFAAAYWVTAKQNGIQQTWAPRYTMFSRGNIAEKARLLTLPSVLSAAATPSTAVDLYAGIGYFAFSYAAAGVSKVLGWDLNPWSIEGLHRGAAANGWPSVYWEPNTAPEDDTAWEQEFCTKAGQARIVAFRDDNETAAESIAWLRSRQVDIPPIRHVNLGLLPSTRDSWPAAAAVLDRTMGGWVHVHMNFKDSEVQDKAEWCAREFQTELISAGWSGEVNVEVENVHRVKTYAPGIWHCVVDLKVEPVVENMEIKQETSGRAE
ncbi:hypothetical protein MBLNU457_5383t1 [Dothideomycetes sp. NU457]